VSLWGSLQPRYSESLPSDPASPKEPCREVGGSSLFSKWPVGMAVGGLEGSVCRDRGGEERVVPAPSIQGSPSGLGILWVILSAGVSPTKALSSPRVNAS